MELAAPLALSAIPRDSNSLPRANSLPPITTATSSPSQDNAAPLLVPPITAADSVTPLDGGPSRE